MTATNTLFVYENPKEEFSKDRFKEFIFPGLLSKTDIEDIYSYCCHPDQFIPVSVGLDSVKTHQEFHRIVSIGPTTNSPTSDVHVHEILARFSKAKWGHPYKG